ncbi:phosphoribosylglycinamide formyltransferase [Lacticaseibacillus baoqingensis]|uniref:Phosphoribosylglycinamide formyltransferase n=1 Tax=Lacticaseibacillus baoqingensis TaxID=2486013 RepID=A0ABW4E2G1_9LACO|nr:phosphoribosylglycinamide formyltransferase [Lacticaseibacillus baoqingensis]
MKHIVVFASGNGSNFAALARYFEGGRHGVVIDLLVCDHPGAYVLTRAAEFGIATFAIDYHAYADKQAAETAILAQLPPCDMIVLAGFMRIIGATLLAAFPERIVNLHPALLPSFPGRSGIQDAYAYGVKVTGVTVHYVDAGIDSGQIIAQEPVRINPEMTLAELETAIHAVEHDLLPKTVADLLTKEKIA